MVPSVTGTMVACDAAEVGTLERVVEAGGMTFAVPAAFLPDEVGVSCLVEEPAQPLAVRNAAMSEARSQRGRGRVITRGE